MFKYFFSCNDFINNKIKSFGNKNSVLPILISCLLYKNNYIFFNLCLIEDVKNLFKIFSSLGIKVLIIKNIAYIYKTLIKKEILKYYYVEKIRASILLISIIIKKFKCGKILFPGGCNLNKRLIDLHLFFLNLNNLKFDFFNNSLNCFFYFSFFKSFNLKFKKYSVGATQNLLIFSTFLKGITTINNASTEPETTELCRFLAFLGIEIIGVGKKKIKVFGKNNIKNCTKKFFFSSDRIEVFTYLSFFLKKNKFCYILNYKSNNFYFFFLFLIFSNFKLKIFKKNNLFFIFLLFNSGCFGINLFFDSFPSLSTDIQPIISSLYISSQNNNLIKDNVFPSRYSYVNALFKKGIEFYRFNNFLLIKGNKKMIPGSYKAEDLRSSAALLISFIFNKGLNCSFGFNYLNRGYNDVYSTIKNNFFKLYKI